MQGYTTAIAAAIALLGTVYVARSSRKTSELSTKIESVQSEANNKRELVKTEVLAQAESAKILTEAETKRIDQSLDIAMGLVKNLQVENRQLRKDMNGIDKTHRQEMLGLKNEMTEFQKQMNECISARSTALIEIDVLKKQQNATLAQMDNVARYYEAGGSEHTTAEDVTIQGKMTRDGLPKSPSKGTVK